MVFFSAYIMYENIKLWKNKLVKSNKKKEIIIYSVEINILDSSNKLKI